MEDFIGLKKLCAEKRNIVYKLYTELANSIIDRDMKLLTEKYPDIKIIKPNYYETNGFQYTINNNVLEIIDRRKSAFLWCFEIVLNDDNLRIGDAFTLNNRIYSVSMIDETANCDILLKIKNVIIEYDNTIEFFKKNNDFTQYAYSYECEHEEIKCPDIFEVYAKVNERKL